MGNSIIGHTNKMITGLVPPVPPNTDIYASSDNNASVKFYLNGMQPREITLQQLAAMMDTYTIDFANDEMEGRIRQFLKDKGIVLSDNIGGLIGDSEKIDSKKVDPSLLVERIAFRVNVLLFAIFLICLLVFGFVGGKNAIPALYRNVGSTTDTITAEPTATTQP